MRRLSILATAVAVVDAACSGGTASSATTTSGATTSSSGATTTTAAATTTTEAATTTTEAGEALTANDDGSYAIDWDAASDTVFFAPAGGGDDPFFHVHNDPAGPGPLGDLGTDFMARGDVTIVQADADGFVAIFSNLLFSDGTTIPGPFTVTG